MKNKKIITFKEASKNATDCLYYPDGVYQYQIKGVWVTVNLKEEIAKILKKYEKKADTILLCSDYEDFLYIFKKYTKKTTEEIRNMNFGSLSISEICIFFGIKVQLTICSQYILNINKNEK